MLLQWTEPSVAPHCNQWKSWRFKFCKALHDQTSCHLSDTIVFYFPITILPALEYTKAMLTSGPLLSLSASATSTLLLFFGYQHSHRAFVLAVLFAWHALTPDTCMTGFLASFRFFLECHFLSEPSLAFLFKFPIPPDIHLTLITNSYRVYLRILIVVCTLTRINLQ